MKKILFVCMAIFACQTAEAAPQRVVSIGGSLTEIIYRLGAADVLVGSDTTSYFPDAAQQLPKVGYQRTLSAEGILSLSPDLVILTDDAGPPPVLLQLKSTGLRLLTLRAGRSVEDVKRNISEIGAVLGYTSRARQLVDEMARSQSALENALATASTRPGVLFILSYTGGAPLAAGHSTAADSIIRLAGGINVSASYKGYKPLTPEAAVSAGADVILVTT